MARVAAVPGYGWQPFAPAPLAHPVDVSQHDGAVVLSNGLLDGRGRCRARHLLPQRTAGYGRLVDGGDLGDSYNYSPPRRDALVDAPVSVTVRVRRARPGARPWRITAVYVWPDHVDGSSQERVGEHQVEVETRAGAESRRARPASGHVVREPESRTTGSGCTSRCPTPARTSQAESAFAVVERGLTAEGRADEFGLPTAPAAGSSPPEA